MANLFEKVPLTSVCVVVRTWLCYIGRTTIDLDVIGLELELT